MPTYTSPRVKWDHELVIGDTYLPLVATLKDSAGVAYDISGATGVCKLRSEPGGEVLLTPTVSLTTDGTDGRFQWEASPATTALLSPGVARYAVRLTFSDGRKKTVLKGSVTIEREAVD